MLKENPRKLAERIDDALYFCSDSMKSSAFYSFETDDEEKNKQNLGEGISSIYKLQLMRDQLTKKVYGREDIAPSEQKEMDEAREKVK